MNITLNINISLFNSYSKTDGKKRKNKKNKKMNKKQIQSPTVLKERNLSEKPEINQKLGVLLKTIALIICLIYL
jgi:hypothetical protein